MNFWYYLFDLLNFSVFIFVNLVNSFIGRNEMIYSYTGNVTRKFLMMNIFSPIHFANYLNGKQEVRTHKKKNNYLRLEYQKLITQHLKILHHRQ